jgi:hypothetical protein
VRRALADARIRAVDVTVIVLAATGSIGEDVLAAFARRALGPHGAAVCARGLAVDGSCAEALAAAAAAVSSADLSSDGFGIAVGLDDGGDVVALCLGRATMARAADPRPESVRA